jgi:hypothetical protein
MLGLTHLRMPSTMMVAADLAAEIGRCNGPNTISTARASARLLSAGKTAYGADRSCHSPGRQTLWRSVAVRELSARRRTSRGSSQRCRVVRGLRRPVVLEQGQLCFPILSTAESREYDRRSALSGPFFFSRRWLFLLGIQRAQWWIRRKAAGGLVVLATQRARRRPGAN